VRKKEQELNFAARESIMRVSPIKGRDRAKSIVTAECFCPRRESVHESLSLSLSLTSLITPTWRVAGNFRALPEHFPDIPHVACLLWEYSPRPWSGFKCLPWRSAAGVRKREREREKERRSVREPSPGDRHFYLDFIKRRGRVPGSIARKYFPVVVSREIS